MFQLLELGDPEWPASVMGLGPDRRDIHFDQRMLAPYTAAYKYKSFLALTSQDEGYIIQPVLWTPEGDLRNCYNFGGPMASSDLLSYAEHSDCLTEWALRNGVRTQYCTLVPLLAQHQLELFNSVGITIEYKKQSVIVNLRDQKVRGTTRRLAIKSKEAGVEVKAYPAETHLRHFLDIYYSTMGRVNAKEHWYFSSKWFEVFVRFVKPCLLLATYEGKFEAGCLVVYSQQYPVSYYHFAGSYNNFPTLGISQQMVLAACEFVKQQGLDYIYLGGGTTDLDTDSLLMFKAGFSKDRLPVYTYSKTYIQEARHFN